MVPNIKINANCHNFTMQVAPMTNLRTIINNWWVGIYGIRYAEHFLDHTHLYKIHQTNLLSNTTSCHTSDWLSLSKLMWVMCCIEWWKWYWPCTKKMGCIPLAWSYVLMRVFTASIWMHVGESNSENEAMKNNYTDFPNYWLHTFLTDCNRTFHCLYKLRLVITWTPVNPFTIVNELDSSPFNNQILLFLRVIQSCK